MTRSRSPHPDDPSSAPESGTVRDDTTGNESAAPNERPPQATPARGLGEHRQRGDRGEDDPSVAGEER